MLLHALVAASLVALALARGRDGEPVCPNYNNNGTGYANIEVRFGFTRSLSLTLNSGLDVRPNVVMAEVLVQQQHPAAHSRCDGFLCDCRQVQHERLRQC